MKKFLWGALLIASACQSSKNDNNPVPASDLNNSTWRVTYFFDRDKEETSDFNGYTFEFREDGSFVANLPGGGTQTGTWQFQDQNTELAILIAGGKPLDDITDDDWDVTEHTANSLKLRDDSDDHVEELHLQRVP